MTDAEFESLSESFGGLDVQSKSGQIQIIRKAIAPEYEKANDVSKSALKIILATAIIHFSNESLEEIFWEAGMPLPEPIVDKVGFLNCIWEEMFPGGDPRQFSRTAN